MRADRVTSTDYRHPYRPLLVRLANHLGGQASRVGLAADLSEESLFAAARRRNRLEDFGDEGFREPLRVLLRSLEEEARLSPVGRWITRERLVGILGNRLRVEALLARHPEILERDLPPLVVITGPQRSGTTLLHRLLASDPACRALATWEALNPAPRLDRRGEPLGDGPTVRQTRLAERTLAYMAPDFFAVHPCETHQPEEDVILLDFAFLSTVPDGTLRAPGYSRWIEEQDLRPAYRYMERLLKILTWRRPGRRWILKTPHHLEFLDTLLEVFPGASVVQTHRDPGVTIASFCSMVAHGQGVFSDEVDPIEIGRHWLRKQARMLDRALDVRLRSDDRRFHDVRYAELMRDPVGVVAGIYEFIGAPFDDVARAAVERGRQENRANRYGKHRYRLADFGLSPEDVRRAFARYVAHFDIPTEDIKA